MRSCRSIRPHVCIFEVQSADGRLRTRHTICFPRRQSGRLIARKHKEKRAPRISRRYYIPQAARPKPSAYVSRATAGRTSRSRSERRSQPMPNAAPCPPKGLGGKLGSMDGQRPDQLRPDRQHEQRDPNHGAQLRLTRARLSNGTGIERDGGHALRPSLVETDFPRSARRALSAILRN